MGFGLRMQFVFMCMQLFSCLRRYVFEALHTWEWTCICGSCLCAWALAHVHETLGRSSTLSIFIYFSSVSLLHAILTHLFVIFASEYHCILLFIFILALKHHISQILLELGI